MTVRLRYGADMTEAGGGRQWMGLTKAHSLVCSLHNDLWGDRARAGRQRMRIFRHYTAAAAPA